MATFEHPSSTPKVEYVRVPLPAIQQLVDDQRVLRALLTHAENSSHLESSAAKYLKPAFRDLTDSVRVIHNLTPRS